MYLKLQDKLKTRKFQVSMRKFFSCECGMGSQQQHTLGYVFTNLNYTGILWFPISRSIENLWDNSKTRL